MILTSKLQLNPFFPEAMTTHFGSMHTASVPAENHRMVVLTLGNAEANNDSNSNDTLMKEKVFS